MACYHCSVKILSRSAGRSSVQFSAYMSGQKQHDERTGETYNHTTKEEVCHNEMLFADRVPDELREQEKFWNSVEGIEKNNNSQVARTWELALPHELTMEQNIEYAQEFARSLVEKDGMPGVQLSIHQKEGNWHAHIMAPTRDMNEKGKWMPKEKKVYSLDNDGNKIPLLDENGEQKYRDRKGKGREYLWQRETVETNNWNSRDYVMDWRERAATMQNLALERAGHEERVDHRSYKEQGVDLIPHIHEGYFARTIGEEHERVKYNRWVDKMNELKRTMYREEVLKSEMKQKFDEWKESIRNVRESFNRRIEAIGKAFAGGTHGNSNDRDGKLFRIPELQAYRGRIPYDDFRQIRELDHQIYEERQACWRERHGYNSLRLAQLIEQRQTLIESTKERIDDATRRGETSADAFRQRREDYEARRRKYENDTDRSADERQGRELEQERLRVEEVEKAYDFSPELER